MASEQKVPSGIIPEFKEDVMVCKEGINYAAPKCNKDGGTVHRGDGGTAGNRSKETI